MSQLNLFKLLALLRKLEIRKLLDFPEDLTDSKACHRWVLALVDSAGALAELSDVELDDEVVNAVRSVVENVDAWNVIHALFVSVVNDESSVNDVVSVAPSTVVDGERYGFNPMIIMAIIQAVSLLLRLLKSRR